LLKTDAQSRRCKNDYGKERQHRQTHPDHEVGRSPIAEKAGSGVYERAACDYQRYPDIAQGHDTSPDHMKMLWLIVTERVMQCIKNSHCK